MRITESYKPNELSRLCQLNDSCFTGLERPPYPDFKAALDTSEHWFARIENDANVDVADVVFLEQIIGYVLVDRHYGAYLWQIAVDPAYRGRGVAGYLMSRAEQWCKSKGDDSMRLHVHSNNPSQKLYFDRGYRVYDVAPGYYGPATTALMMKKVL